MEGLSTPVSPIAAAADICVCFAAAQAPGEAAHAAAALSASADQACLPRRQPRDTCQSCSSLEGPEPAAEPSREGRAAGRRADRGQPAGRVERRCRQHAAQPGAALRARGRHQRSRVPGEDLLFKLCMDSCTFSSMTDWTPSPSCTGHGQMVAPSNPSHRERSGLP